MPPFAFLASGLGNKEPAFTVDGDWCSELEKHWKILKKHVSSSVHGDCYTEWNNYMKSLKTGSIAAQLSVQYKNDVQRNRECASKIIEILLFLGRQGMPFRGHDQHADSHNKGNVLELCRLFAKYDDEFAKKLAGYLI